MEEVRAVTRVSVTDTPSFSISMSSHDIDIEVALAASEFRIVAEIGKISGLKVRKAGGVKKVFTMDHPAEEGQAVFIPVAALGYGRTSIELLGVGEKILLNIVP